MELPSQPCARGLALASLAKATRSHSRDRLAHALESTASTALQRTLLEIDERHWYPAEAFFELLEVIHHEVVDRDLRVLERLGEAAIEADMRGFHRWLLRVLSPSYAVHSSKRIMAAYLNYGTIEIIERSPISARLEVRLEPGCELFWPLLAGAIRGVLKHAGAFDVRVDRDDDGTASRCRFRMQWS